MEAWLKSCTLACWLLTSFHTITAKLSTQSDANTCPDALEACAANVVPGGSSIPGVDVHVPEAISRTVTTAKPPRLAEGCCWSSFQTIYDAEGKPLLVSAEDFLCNPSSFRQLAERPDKEGLMWRNGHIHLNDQVSDPEEALLTGNGWPGARLELGSGPQRLFEEVDTLIASCLQPIVDHVWPGFNLMDVRKKEHLLGLISPPPQTGGKWLDAQRTPHNDIRWEIGAASNGIIPPCLATVLPLTHNFEDSGTSIWRVKRTKRSDTEKYSLLETLSQNQRAQGTFSTKAGPRDLFPDLDLRKEIPDPYPHEGLSNAWLEAIAVARLKYNRLVVYDGRRLHNQYMQKEAYSRLSLNASTGRLTMNSFFWQAHEHIEQRKPANEDRLFTRMETKEVTSIPGVQVLLPKLVRRVTSTKRPDGLPSVCCWSSFEALRDKKGTPIFATIDNFLCDINDIVEFASWPDSVRTRKGDVERWVVQQPTPDPQTRDIGEAILRGSGVPGSLLGLPRKLFRIVDDAVTECLRPVLEELWPGFDLHASREVGRQHRLSLMSPERQLDGRWLDAQRLPHNEIRWDLGTRSGGAVPPSLALHLGLTASFNDTGYSAWRVKRTARSSKERLSLLKTLDQNEAAQGAFSARRGPRGVHPELDVRKEIPDPHPHYKLSHSWAEAIAVATLRFNRLIVVDGRRLQNDYVEPSAYPRSSLSPVNGRLVMDSFLWEPP